MSRAWQRALRHMVWGLCLGQAAHAQDVPDASASEAPVPMAFSAAGAAPLPSEAAEALQHPPDAAPISLNFQQIGLRALLQVFAEFTGLNFVASDKLERAVSVRLQALPWPRALEVVLQSQGLVARQHGRVVWVLPEDEWLQREKKRLEAQTTLEGVGTVQTQSWRLQYLRATELAQRLLGLWPGAPAGQSGRWLSARGKLLAEPRTNQLFISDVPARLRELQAMIAQLDVPVRQVMIEARIVEADAQFGQSLGVRWGVGASRTVTVDGQATRLGQLGAGSATDGPGAKPGAQLAFPAALAGQTVVAPASVAVSLFSASAERFINMELSALEAEGRGQVVSRPRVITADQTKALIEQGTELPYQTATTTGVTTVSSLSFRKANLKLEVTPQITPEGEVVLEVDVNRDSVGQITQAGYAINTKHVKTQVRVPDGGTVVLGGIYEDSDKHDNAGLPRLAQWPLVGWLFGQRQLLRRRNELLVFLTPKVLSDAAAAGLQGPAAPAREPGGEPALNPH